MYHYEYVSSRLSIRSLHYENISIITTAFFAHRREIHYDDELSTSQIITNVFLSEIVNIYLKPINVLLNSINKRRWNYFVYSGFEGVSLKEKYTDDKIDKYYLALAILFVVPTTLIGIALKIIFLIASPLFRKQEILIINYIKRNAGRKKLLAKLDRIDISNSIPGFSNIPSVVIMNHLSHYFSSKDLYCISSVCHAWRKWSLECGTLEINKKRLEMSRFVGSIINIFT